MKLFIQVQNGQAHEHPILEPNFKDAFPSVNVDSLPPEFARFIRVPQPTLGPYETNQRVSYQLVDGQTQTYTDFWETDSLTAEEITAKQQAVKDAWAIDPNWSSWTFNETTCSYDPPVPQPDNPYDSPYHWNEEALAWRNADETYQWNPTNLVWDLIEVSE